MRSLSEFADEVCAALQFSKTARVFNGASISGFTFVGGPGGDGSALGIAVADYVMAHAFVPLSNE
jgi:acetyl-CoA carboxylase alpha subunit